MDYPYELGRAEAVLELTLTDLDENRDRLAAERIRRYLRERDARALELAAPEVSDGK